MGIGLGIVLLVIGLILALGVVDFDLGFWTTRVPAGSSWSSASSRWSWRS